MNRDDVCYGVHLSREAIIYQRELALRRPGSEFLAEVFNELTYRLDVIAAQVRSGAKELPEEPDPEGPYDLFIQVPDES